MSKGRILVVDDDPSILEVLALRLRSQGYEVSVHSSGRSAQADLRHSCYHVALVDLRLDREDGIEVLERLLEIDSALAVIIMTAHGTIDSTVEAMRRGAFGYVTKPFDTAALLAEIERARAGAGSVRPDREAVLGEIVGQSAAMERVRRQILQVAAGNSTVLIVGESGTGKELVARAIHRLSERSRGPFVAVNCGAVPEALGESEFFGHVRGAFTGAHRDRKGHFQRAEGGTLFLDEIAETSPALQVKLLRSLEEREVTRVGGDQPEKFDARMISSTNRDLDVEVRGGRFRADLFYRLHVIPLAIPPLRERKEDIPLLVRHFLGRLARKFSAAVKRLEEETLEFLKFYDWPGNVRELQNVLERAVVTSSSGLIRAPDLGLKRSSPFEGQDGKRILNFPPEGISLEEIEKEAILQALESQNWVQKKAGELLGISPRVMTYKVQKYGLRRGGR